MNGSNNITPTKSGREYDNTATEFVL